MHIKDLLVYVALSVGGCFGANILVMLPLPLFSHTNTYMPIIKDLANRGHNVTMVSPYEEKEVIPNLKIIPIKNALPEEMKAGPGIMDAAQMGIWLQLMGFWYYSTMMSSNVLQEPPIQALIHDTSSHFDLVITETFFMQEVMVAFGHKFNAPVINLNPASPTSWVAYLTGNLNPYSYVSCIRFAMSDNMNYFQRVKNSLWQIFELSSGLYYYLPQQEALMKQHFNYTGSENLPPLLVQLKNTSITLVDSHFSMGYPRPYHSNIIEIGGLSIKEGEILPSDLQDFMDNAEDGVIYFSMGSYLKSQDLQSETFKALQSAFGKLKQKVLWKWDGANIPKLPSNVRTAKWFPQNSILAHAKCVLFITHGGLHSLFEATYNKVPVISIPIFADQPYNAKFAEESGFGITLNIDNMTEETLISAVETIINTPTYKENAERMSFITKDRPIAVLKNAIYWIEYVINHKGATHLKPKSLQISFCRYLLLDIFVPLSVIALAVIYVFVKLCKCCLKLCRSKKDGTDKIKNKTE